MTKGITRAEIVLGLALACTSGAGLIAATFLAIPLSFTAPFIVLPTAAVLAGIALLHHEGLGFIPGLLPARLLDPRIVALVRSCSHSR